MVRSPFRSAATTAIGALAIASVATAGASAQQASGVVTATCNVMGTPAQLYAQYEVYGDYTVFQDRVSRQFQDIVGSGYTNTHWQGYVDTQFGRYNLSGENNFIDAIPAGGYYSQKVTYEVISTGQNTFMFKDFFNDGQPVIPCQITGMQ